MPPASDQKNQVRQVSEGTRERELVTYVESILDTFKRNDQGKPLPSDQLRTSPDAILTALTQLAAFRTKTARSMISIFDQDYQYIAAESTVTTGLAPGASTNEDSNIWLCGSAIPRIQGVCDFTVREGAKDDNIKFGCNGDIMGPQLPLTRVEDLGQDPNFCERPYCLAGSPAKFYAAVPIRTKRRINIGVICVIHNEPVPWWNDEHTQTLRDLSQMVMDHWDATRIRNVHRRSERMNRGMGSFLEDRSTISGWKDGEFPGAYEDKAGLEGALNKQQQASQQKEYEALQLQQPVRDALPDTEPPPKSTSPDEQDREGWIKPSQVETMGHSVAHEDSLSTPKPHRVHTAADHPSDQSQNRQLAIDNVFDKAANIIRESLEIEGCLFIDPTLTTYGSMVDSSRHKANPNFALSEQSSGAEGDDSRVSDAEGSLQYCRMLGFSTSRSHSINGDNDAPFSSTVAQKFVTVLLQRYPQGKIFNFDCNGDLLSSDSSDDSAAATPDGLLSPGGLHSQKKMGPPHTKHKPWAREQEGKNISDIFPGARSVAFMPIWDSKKEGWFAASFAYTHSQARTFTVRGELTYLKAFGILAMEHVLRLETMHDDKAKSDALSCISHELRSPLHGILLSVELLNDTPLSVTQGNILHSLETCCRTMLDTIDHLLDFSNINSVSKQKKRLSPGRNLRTAQVMEPGPKSLQPTIKLHILAEEVIESVFAGFQFQHTSVRQFSQRQKGRNDDVAAHNYLDGVRAAEDGFGAGTFSSEPGSKSMVHDGVKVFFMVNPKCDWSFHANSGALRRIIMNLFGNALKYTPAGMIKVSLTQKVPKVESRKKTRTVVITVADTGIGMSQDYLRNQLFRPFAQENALSPGTGLGLSLVRQLTSQLRGRISVDSCVGVGTTVTVTLPLKPVANAQAATGSEEEASASKIEDQAHMLRGLRIRLIGFPGDEAANPGRTASGEHDESTNTMQSICTDWLNLEVIADNDAGDIMPDLVLLSADSLQELEKNATLRNTPTVVVCNNALVAYEQSASYDRGKQENPLVEFVSQPVGPHKLARIMSLLFDRWRSIQDFPLQNETFASADGEPPAPEPRKLTAQPPSDTPSSKTTSTGSAGSQTPPTTPCQNETIDPVFSIDNSLQTMETQPSKPVTAQPPGSGVTTKLPTRPPMNRSPSSTIIRTSKFLLVDDNAINLKILKTYMTKLKCSFQGATNGQEAVDAYKELSGGRKCILMDISMPVMDGLEATRRIRAIEASQKLEPAVIIALTGLGSQETQKEAFTSGVDLFLTKPVQLKELGGILLSKNLMS